MKLILFYNQHLALFVFSIYSEPRQTDEFLNSTPKPQECHYYETEQEVWEVSSRLKSTEKVTLKKIVFYTEKNGSQHVELCKETASAKECKEKNKEILPKTLVNYTTKNLREEFQIWKRHYSGVQWSENLGVTRWELCTKKVIQNKS